MKYEVLRSVYTCEFARCDCHPGVCNKLMTVYRARYPLVICCNLSSTLSSDKLILQDINHKAQNLTCKQPLMKYTDGQMFILIFASRTETSTRDAVVIQFDNGSFPPFAIHYQKIYCH